MSEKVNKKYGEDRNEKQSTRVSENGGGQRGGSGVASGVNGLDLDGPLALVKRSGSDGEGFFPRIVDAIVGRRGHPVATVNSILHTRDFRDIVISIS